MTTATTNIRETQTARKGRLLALAGAFLLSGVAPTFAAIDNTASVNGTFGPSSTTLYDGTPGNEPPTSTESVPLVTPAPAYLLTKTSSDPAAAVAGDVITYTFTLQNTGNVTLLVNDISDPGPSFDGGATNQPLTSGPTLDSGDTDTDSELDVGETWVYTATYELTQADIDAAAGVTDGVSNLVTVDITDTDPTTPTTATADPASDPDTTSTIDVDPNLVLAKVAYDTAYSDDGDDLNDGAPIVGNANVGDTIYYRFTVTNNSNVTASNIAVSEDSFTVNGGAPAGTLSSIALVGGTTTLAPGESAIFEATYVVTQADVDSQ